MKIAIAPFLVAACVVSLAGCAHQQDANFRYPRPDELRPGDIPPPVDAPVSRTRVPDDGYRQRAVPYFAPPPPVPFYPMQIPERRQQRQPMSCSTRWVGQTAYTDCN